MIFTAERQKVNLTSPQEANHQGIETVYQDLALCDNLDVIGRTRYPAVKLAAGISRVFGSLKKEWSRTLEVLKVLNVRIPSVRVPVAGLSGGQRQCIAVAKTILRIKQALLMPTAALGVVQTRQVLNSIVRLREQGLLWW